MLACTHVRYPRHNGGVYERGSLACLESAIMPLWLRAERSARATRTSLPSSLSISRRVPLRIARTKIRSGRIHTRLLLAAWEGNGAEPRERRRLVPNSGKTLPAERPQLDGRKMTAEIALLNRRALAFAADSAVTISDGTNSKIYNSAEKIFELSRRVPIGVMLYNTMEFVGVPLDVLIRKFRAENDKDFLTCRDACDAFLEYLCAFERYKDNEDGHLQDIIEDALLAIQKEHRAKFPVFLRSEIRSSKTGDIDPDAISKKLLIKILTDHTKVHEQHPLDDFLLDITEDKSMCFH
jgi:hypothetical protein